MSGDNLTYREKFSYGFGDLASVLYWQTFMLYLTIFYTDVFGLSALAAGAMIGLSRALDAFFDPVMGMIADRTNTRWGKYRPYLLWFCVPMAIAGVLTFTTPGGAVSAKLLAWFGEPVRTGFGGLSSCFGWLSGATASQASSRRCVIDFNLLCNRAALQCHLRRRCRQSVPTMCAWVMSNPNQKL